MTVQNSSHNANAVFQDLHIHTTYSTGDSAVVPEQTVQFIAALTHARIVGISDHFEYLTGKAFADYEKTVRSHKFYVGTEINGALWVTQAAELNFDYFLYHCRDRDEDYRGTEVLLSTGKPVIIAHPFILETNLNRLPSECLIEINNRYIWRNDWKSCLKRYIKRFRFVLSSDAHQPNWLNQLIAQYVAGKMGIKETILFNRAPGHL